MANFILVSRLIKPKNIEIVIKAFKILKEDNLWVVGDGKDRKYFESIASNNVKFFGFVSEEKLKELYKKAYACIMPHIYEPFGLVPYEIAKYGKPSIISELSGIGYLAKKYKFGLLFNPYDLNDLIEKIEMIKNNKIYKELSKNAKRLIIEINKVNEVNKFIRLLTPSDFKNKKDNQ